LEIAEKLDLEPNLSPLRKGIIQIYQKGFRSKASERAVRHTCHQIEEVLKTPILKMTA